MDTTTAPESIDLTQAQKELVLLGTPGFHRLSAGARTALATALRATQLAPLSVMPDLDATGPATGDPVLDRYLVPHQLTIAWRGALTTTQTRPAAQTTWLRAGHVALGADTVATWMDDHRAGWRGLPAFQRFTGVLPVRTSYQALDYVDALQLPDDAYVGLFGEDAPHADELLDVLLDAWAVETSTPKLAASLMRLSQLVHAPPTLVTALLEGARWLQLDTGQTWETSVPGHPERPALGVLAHGTVELLQPGTKKPWTRLVGEGAWGLTGLINGTNAPPAQVPTSSPPACIVAVPQARVAREYRRNLTFQRLLDAHGVPDDSPLRAPHRIPGQAVVLLTARRPLEWPEAHMGRALARTIEEELHDNVLLVRLRWSPSGPSGSPPTTTTWHEAVGNLDQAKALIAKLDETIRPSPNSEVYDVVLVDALDLQAPPNATPAQQQALEDALHHLWAWRGWTRLSWMYRDVGDWRTVPFAAAQNPALLMPTRLLGPLTRSRVLPSVLHAWVALVEDWLAIYFRILAALAPGILGIEDFFADLSAQFWEWAAAQADEASSAAPYQPLQAVRLRFDADIPRDGDRVTGDGSAMAYSRWARAVTGRRMGLALGGGGALGYAHVAFLRALQGLDPQTGEPTPNALLPPVPVDVITGTSFGAVVAAYYAAAGAKEGMDRVVCSWPLAMATATFAILTTYGFKLWIDTALGRITLDQFSVTYIPVATAAVAEQAVPVARELVGSGVRASGSFPPFAPTILQDVRLLDGGIVANVPVYTALRYGADLVVASNPVPMFDVLSTPIYEAIPILGPVLGELSPMGRVKDLLRAYLPLIRNANNAEALAAQVTFSSDVAAAPFAFWQARRIVKSAAQSQTLQTAVAAATQLWQMRLRGGPSN